MLKTLVEKNRSYRRFFEEKSISTDTLKELIELARLTPSGANKQALRYYLTTEKDEIEKIFPHLGWAGYLKDWAGPEKGERPTGYILLLQKEDYKLGSPYDAGIAAQTILLGAVEKGLGGCILANIHHQKLKKDLDLPEDMDILLVLAIGVPKETVVIDEIPASEDIKYWRESNGTHHVPKVRLSDLIIK
jgi:nitroreductase